MTGADKAFLHNLYQKHYANRPAKRSLETCVRCGAKGVLGKRKGYEGLCHKCRAQEFRVRNGL